MRKRTSKVGIVLVDVCEGDRNSLEEMLSDTRWELTTATETEAAIRDAATPIVIYNSNDADCWRTSVSALASARRDACVIVLGSEAEGPSRTEVVHCGGFDLLTCPLRREQVLPMLLFAYTYCRGQHPWRARRALARQRMEVSR